MAALALGRVGLYPASGLPSKSHRQVGLRHAGLRHAGLRHAGLGLLMGLSLPLVLLVVVLLKGRHLHQVG